MTAHPPDHAPRRPAALMLLVLLGGWLGGCQAPAVPADGTPPPTPPTTGGAESAGPTPTGIPTESPFAGYLAPNFTLPDLDGRPVRLSDYRGHPVWLNLWATWCGPCQVELPAMQTLYTRYKSDGLIILGVDVQEDADAVRKYVSAGLFDWHFLLDHEGAVARRYYMTGLPLHVFIDRGGTIRAVQAGGLDPQHMEVLLHHIIGR